MQKIILLLLICLTLGCGDRSEGAIGNSNRHYAKGDYEKAISKSLDALRSHQYTEEAKAELNYIIAQSHEKLGELDKSIALHKYIVANFPDTKVAILSKTEIQ